MEAMTAPATLVPAVAATLEAAATGTLAAMVVVTIIQAAWVIFRAWAKAAKTMVVLADPTEPATTEATETVALVVAMTAKGTSIRAESPTWAATTTVTDIAAAPPVWAAGLIATITIISVVAAVMEEALTVAT